MQTHGINQNLRVCIGSKTRSTILSGNRTTHLATCRHLHPWNAVQKVTKFVLQSPNQVRTKRNPTSHLPVHGFCVLDVAPLKVCLAFAIPSKDEEKPRHRIFPCMDFANWTIPSLLTFLSPATQILYHVKDEEKSYIASFRT